MRYCLGNQILDCKKFIVFSLMTIRTATFEDIKDIATIHVNAWQVAYKGLIPQS